MNNTDGGNKSDKKTQAGFYAVVLVCVIAIGATAIVAHNSSINRDANEIGAHTELVSQGAKSDADGAILPSDDDKVLNVPALDSDVRSAGADVKENETSRAASSTPKKYVRPVAGMVISAFSGDELVYSKTLSDWRTHGGTDYKASIGEAVRAIADGSVTDVTTDDMMGVCITVSHEGELSSRYCGLSENVNVQKGQSVKAGDTLGGVGDSAVLESAIEPHLHLEVTKGASHIDPESLFS